MAALDAGCARNTRAHWDAHALAKGRASYKKVSTPLFVSLSFLPVLSLSSSFTLHTTFLKFFLSTYHNQLWLSPLNTNFVSLLKPSTSLGKSLAVDHYLRIEYFQQFLLEMTALMGSSTRMHSWEIQALKVFLL